jgi:hypothetical protein
MIIKVMAYFFTYIPINLGEYPRNYGIIGRVDRGCFIPFLLVFSENLPMGTVYHSF